MSIFGDVMASVRKAVLIDHRLDELSSKVEALSRREAETRERLIYIEGVLAGAGAPIRNAPRLPPA